MIFNSPMTVLVAFFLAVQLSEISAIRNKRAAAPKYLTLNMNPTPDADAETAFASDPVNWLKKNSISSFPVHKFALNPQTRVTLQNGGFYSFRFAKVEDKKYVYYATPVSEYGIRGYWLGTNDKIIIRPNSESAFIFTAELQGWSIHTKILPDGRMEAFHRDRQHLHHIYLDGNKKPIDNYGAPIRELVGVTNFLDKNGKAIVADANGKISLNNGILDQNGNRVTKINGKGVEELIDENLDRGTDELCQYLNYDLRGGKSVSWEDYQSDLPDSYVQVLAAAPGEESKFITPFLFRKNGVWKFVSQQIRYAGSGIFPAGTSTEGRMYNFESTGIGHMTVL